MYREWISLCCATVFVLLLVACLGIGGGASRASAAAASRVGRGGAVASDSDQAVLVDGDDHPLAAGLADVGMDAPPTPQAMAG